MKVKEKLIKIIVDDFINTHEHISVIELQRELDRLLKFKKTVSIDIFDGIQSGSIFFRDSETNNIKSVTFTK